ncbi:PEP-CTERM sorting domain-containing protein [Chlorobium sp. N1]|uniref:PEP-CTERM sorting domain-containing protein n=1 Tax=Chlorobium sp. N1 TaxID=2491138 RepID=UPI00103E73E3|nr:PEP-CTERM sorting domain-containing protein [Chlorobium sp. N1]TCD47547.1 PEP-CTERM sorting domain-containing protein [Chlorobium sp. N1]
MDKIKQVIRKGVLAACMALAGTLATGSGLQAAQGDLINIKFNTTYTGAGAIGDGNDIWNIVYQTGDASSSKYDLKNSDNTTMTDVDFSATWTGSTTDTNNTFVSNIYSENASSTMQFSGLSAGEYDLYIYTQTGVDNFDYSVASGSSWMSTESITAGGNAFDVVVLTTTVGDDGQLLINYGDTGIDYVNGIQLLQTSEAAPVPEPATVMLLGVGGIGIAFMRRRRMMMKSA